MRKLLATISNQKNSYEIWRGKDDKTYCTCWAWRRYKKCKHLLMYFSKECNAGYTLHMQGIHKAETSLEEVINTAVDKLKQGARWN